MDTEKYTTRNRDSRKTGANAEAAVAEKLEREGVAILARNCYSRWGELDIVTKERGVIVFVEVKYRKSCKFGTPAEAVTYSKQRKIIKTAQFSAKR